MRHYDDIEQAVELYGSIVWRACCVYFSGKADAQDAFQETFLRYATADSREFAGEDHRKAWLIRVATNVCKDMLKAAHRGDSSFDAAGPEGALASIDPYDQPGSFTYEVVSAIRALDDPPRTPLYLSLCEGFTAAEIADEQGVPVNTVYSWLARGKKLLKEALS